MHEPVGDDIHLKTVKKKAISIQKLLPRKNMNIFYTLLHTKKSSHQLIVSCTDVLRALSCTPHPKLPSHDIHGEGTCDKALRMSLQEGSRSSAWHKSFVSQ